MNNKIISVLLALSLALCGITPVFAEEETPDAAAEAAAREEWEADLGDFTSAPANAYTEQEAKNLVGAEETDHAYEVDFSDDADEDNAQTSPYVEGEVLFAREEGDISLASDDDLSDIGITGIEEVYRTGTDSGISLASDASPELVWYKADTSGDVLETVKSLNDVPSVVKAEPNYIYETADIEANHGIPGADERNHNWFMDDGHDDRCGVRVHDGWKHSYENTKKAPGSGVVVAVIDTGVDYNHEDLAASMWVNAGETPGNGADDDGNGYIDDVYGVDTTAGTYTKTAGDPMDNNGHGTHVAGIIAMADNEKGGVGIAYGAKIMAIKAGQATGTLASADVAEAIQYAVSMGADVINMSFGGTGKSSLIEDALEDAFTTTVLVASAGNEGIPTSDAPEEFIKKADYYPAGYNYVLGVMASGADGSLASFSNWDYDGNANAEYEVAAPGVDIYSTLPDNKYGTWSGTSMAAPAVSAIAAVIRSNYTDKDEYNSRFIMGQIASATDLSTTYIDKIGKIHTYARADLYESLTKLPKPNLSVSEVFALDLAKNSPVNDGDRTMDAGETIDLGIQLRNQWGKTEQITVTADAVSDMGVANKYVQFEKDTITLDPAGTFSNVDNGYVWNDSYLESVTNPIRFTLSPDTPNDTEIAINLHISTKNGWDKDDTEEYTTDTTFTFRVQSGQSIRGHIKEDTTLTNDKYWIIENALLIDEGATLTIEPGTQIQFWSADYEDAYGQKTIVYINCEGKLNAIGTEDAPIEMFPGAQFEQYCVRIYGDGEETLEYCNIINPYLYYNYDGVDSCNHCRLIQSYDNIVYRSPNNNIENTVLSNLYIQECENSYISGIKSMIDVQIKSSRSNIFNGGVFYDEGINSYSNCVFIGKDYYNENRGAFIRGLSPVPIINSKPVFHEPVTYDGAASKYVFMKRYNYDYSRDDQLKSAENMAAGLGGTLACIDNLEEEDFLCEQFFNISVSDRVEGDATDRWIYAALGCMYNDKTGEYKWDDGSSYKFSLAPEEFYGQRGNLTVYCYGTSSYSKRGLSFSDSRYEYIILEIPASKTDEQIMDYLTSYSNVRNNAILNPVLNTNPDIWFKFQAPDYDSRYYYSLANNYWGTENTALINQMIIDDDDYPGTYGDIVEDPILTHSDDLSSIYPFVLQIWLEDEKGTMVEEAAPGKTYEVHVKYNRDMDQTVQPTITYGGDAPYTDYNVYGDWESPREWVGTTKISSVATGGTQIFRAKGGCAADDNWLECGEDELRFQFNIQSSGVLAMMLNATGGTNKVELSWAQNDYETLGGYNLYRSTEEKGEYQKLNDSILTETEYTDTDVAPGVTYYYYFTVVDTDGNEVSTTQSNIASATPVDNIFPVLTHSPVTTAKAGTSVAVSAKATDNIAVESVKLYYRKSGTSAYTEKELTYNSATDLYSGTIPADIVTNAGVDYYITASDTDGNTSYSGTAQLPNVISVNTSAYISGITPSKIKTEGGQTVTVLGGNFTDGMTLKVGDVTVAEYTLIDAGQINFTAPAMALGSYAVSLTAYGKTVNSPTALSYADDASVAQIPTNMEMVSGMAYKIPLYLTAAGDVVSLHAELDLPRSDFASVSVEKADPDANFTLDYNYTNGVLKIGCIGTSNINTADSPVVNIIVTPAVTEDKQYKINLHDVSFNGVAVNSVISGDAYIRQSYEINAVVNYFAGTNNFVKDVTISAAGFKAVTNSSGSASLFTPERDVIISASRETSANAVTAYDASMVLQSAIGKITLNDNQRLAADVDGSEKIDEYDAALILQKAVKKIDAFPINKEWIFVPPSIEKTLSAYGATRVSFTAIVIGDVDGSYRGDTE